MSASFPVMAQYELIETITSGKGQGAMSTCAFGAYPYPLLEHNIFFGSYNMALLSRQGQLPARLGRANLATFTMQKLALNPEARNDLQS